MSLRLKLKLLLNTHTHIIICAKCCILRSISEQLKAAPKSQVDRFDMESLEAAPLAFSYNLRSSVLVACKTSINRFRVVSRKKHLNSRRC